MKKFTFPLDRVLAWRRTQIRLEEAALARLTAERQSLDARAADLRQSLAHAQANALTQPTTTSTELAALEHYRRAAAAQSQTLARQRQTLETRIAAQTQTVLVRRRDAELLGRLRQRRLDAWNAAHLLELDQLAEESHRARMSRDAHQVR